MANNFSQLKSLVQKLTLGQEKETAFLKIWNQAYKAGIFPASIHDLYIQRAESKVPTDFTVPAFNLRGLTFDLAQTIFKIALKKNVGALIFELARSEMSYTNQPPHEYAGVILAAALSAGFEGPVFIQGDHFHFRVSEDNATSQQELSSIKNLSIEAMDAGFFNIDIDASTLVDYDQQEIKDQQKPNYLATAELANYIRANQPEGIEISLGGEIGHIGGKNSTEEELRAFAEGFLENLDQDFAGLSKISIQTGTHHGGVVLADGTLAEVAVDFDVLKRLSKMAREYQMGGAVQHGASTLPKKYFSQFPQSEAIEIHLATEFQNLIFDHPSFPPDLLKKMYQYLDQEKLADREVGQTDEQFHYKMRKTAWGPFKEQLWAMPQNVKENLLESVSQKVEFLFEELNVVNTQEMIKKTIKPSVIKKDHIKQNLSKSLDFTSLDPD